MDPELTAALERLSCADAARLLYGAYEYLRDLPHEVPSATQALLRQLGKGEAEALLFAVKKMLEEQEEVRLVLAGRHTHEGQSRRETLINELQQFLYWPCLIAVGRGVPYEVIRLPEFLERGLNGQEPAKQDVDEGGLSEAAILRRVAASAGRAIAEFNAAHAELPPVTAREIVLADLRQMAGKDHLRAYLQPLKVCGRSPASHDAQRGSVPRGQGSAP
jgi:hypothetical protein